MDELPLIGNALHKAEMEYHGRFGHTLGRIQQISLINIIYICYTTWCLETQTVAPNLTGFQGIKLCIQYLTSHLHKTVFNPYNSYDG